LRCLKEGNLDDMRDIAVLNAKEFTWDKVEEMYREAYKEIVE